MSLILTHQYDEHIMAILENANVASQVIDGKLYVSLEAMKEALPDKNENQVLVHFRELIKTNCGGNYYLIWAVCINGGYLLETYNRTGKAGMHYV